MADTETVLKLRDAANQMLIAIDQVKNEEKFRTCINAFLSTARSVTMVLERECSHLQMRDWYKAQMSKLGNTPLFCFFNAQRVYSIHRGVVKPVRKSHKASLVKSWHELDKSGKPRLHATVVVHAEVPEININDVAQLSDDGTIWVWCFNDIEEFMPGDTGNVLRLCESYYAILKWLVEEWFREQLYRGISNPNSSDKDKAAGGGTH